MEDRWGLARLLLLPKALQLRALHFGGDRFLDVHDLAIREVGGQALQEVGDAVEIELAGEGT